MIYNPGDDLAARYPEWVWRRRELHGIPEVLCHRRRVILTDRRLTRIENRCTLAHALAHLDLGHVGIFDGVVEAQDELAADRLAARRLIDVHDLACFAVEDRPVQDLAAALHVTTAVLDVRAKYLHPSERGLIRRRHSMKERTA